MADGSSCESWLDRWRAGCRSKDATCLLALLVEDRESGKANMGALTPGDVEEAVRVAGEAGSVGLLRPLINVVEEGKCGLPGMFDRAFQAACQNGHLPVIRELLGLRGVAAVNVHAEGQFGRETGFVFACQCGQVAVVRELLSLGGDRVVDVHAGPEGNPEAGFRLACQNGNLDVVRELLSLSGHREVDVHAGAEGWPEAGFRVACVNGHVGVVRELLALTGDREVDVHAGGEGRPDLGFRHACQRGRTGVLRELLGLTGHRAIPLQARLAAGRVAVQPAKDAVWAGTSTRRGRADMVLLRACAGR